MKHNESILRFVVKNEGYENVNFVISGYSSSISNIREAIREFAFRKHDLAITQISDNEFELNKKSYMAIQHVIFEKMF